MNLKSITVGYYLVCKHLWEQMKQKVDPLEIMASVKEVAMAETVPPWPKLKWDKLLESFYPSQSLYYKEIDFDQNNDMRVVFVHQLSRAEGKDRNEFLATIRSVIADGQFPPITEKHAEMVKEKHPQLKELVFESFDPNNANSCLEGMARFIKLERVYTSMASVVTVCIVSRENLASLHSHLMQWAQIIILSRMQRETKINQEILRKLKMDIARAAADV